MKWITSRLLRFVSFLLALALLPLLLLSCGVSRSPLLQDPSYPRSCKMALECAYMFQNGETRSQCLALFSPACTKKLVYETCRADNKSPREIDSCMLKLK